MSDQESTARGYYQALDDHDYDRLADLLAPEFVQHRPDRTFEGRERFVEFMREQRPMTDTSHAIDCIYRTDGTGDLAVRGRLLDSDEEQVVGFVDVFSVAADGVTKIETYTQ